MIKNFSCIGLPYHGLVTNNTLKLASSQSIQYSGLTSGDTQLVAIPNYQKFQRTSEQQEFDKKNGFQWKNHALVTDNHLGGINLGKDWLLYIDGNHVVWYLAIGYNISGNDCHMNCTLKSVFGRFGKNYPMILKPLAEAKTHLSLSGTLKHLNRFTFERKHDGSEILIHVYAKLDQENVVAFPEPLSLIEIWKLKVTGNGRLSEGNDLGEGISAAFSKYKSYSDISKNVNKPAPKLSNQYRVGKINIKNEDDPGPPKPPECHANTLRSSFNLALVPDGESYIPFALDQNLYIQTNWYGEQEKKTTIVRMLFDELGAEHTLSVLRGNKKLNRIYQTFQGSGMEEKGPIQYYFNGWTCVVNGNPPTRSEYQWSQYVESGFKIIQETSLLLDDAVVNTLSLEGETAQSVTTLNGNISASNTKVTVKINSDVVREWSNESSKVPNRLLADPFSGVLPGDDGEGVYMGVSFGLIANNLLGQFVDRYLSSDKKTITQKESHCVISPSVRDNTVISHPSVFYLKGSFNPFTKEMIRYQEGIQAWV